MHSADTIKHGSHHLHDGMISLWEHIGRHLHSRHFWAGVGVALLIVGIAAVLLILARNAPLKAPLYPYGVPYTPIR